MSSSPTRKETEMGNLLFIRLLMLVVAISYILGGE